MRRVVVATGIVLVLGLASGLPSWGQRATEVFIPIGQSPGLSGNTTVIGEITSVDPAARTLTVRGEGGPVTVRLTDETKIWLDRSVVKRTSGRGSPADCKAGRWCEVHFVYEGERRTGVADWIKVRIGD